MSIQERMLKRIEGEPVATWDQRVAAVARSVERNLRSDSKDPHGDVITQRGGAPGAEWARVWIRPWRDRPCETCMGTGIIKTESLRTGNESQGACYACRGLGTLGGGGSGERLRTRPLSQAQIQLMATLATCELRAKDARAVYVALYGQKLLQGALYSSFRILQARGLMASRYQIVDGRRNLFLSLTERGRIALSEGAPSE